MVRIEYKCNLCEDVCDKSTLLCVYWKCDIIPQRYTLVKDLTLADKHICVNCMRLIRENDNAK